MANKAIFLPGHTSREEDQSLFCVTIDKCDERAMRQVTLSVVVVDV
jgi:hypothetical protein